MYTDTFLIVTAVGMIALKKFPKQRYNTVKTGANWKKNYSKGIFLGTHFSR